MRLLRWMICIPVAMAAVMGADATATKSLAARSSTTASTSTSTSSTSEVAFLQLLQTAQINSMACLITLVNMTYNDIGTCLGLSTLATLVVSPSNNQSFSDQLDSYLTTTCAATECTSTDIADAQSQLASTCSEMTQTGLVTVLNQILDQYTASYRTLACSVYL
jgi:hypothetical protein